MSKALHVAMKCSCCGKITYGPPIDNTRGDGHACITRAAQEMLRELGPEPACQRCGQRTLPIDMAVVLKEKE